MVAVVVAVVVVVGSRIGEATDGIIGLFIEVGVDEEVMLAGDLEVDADTGLARINWGDFVTAGD